MNPQEDRDLEKKLRELEMEIDKTSSEPQVTKERYQPEKFADKSQNSDLEVFFGSIQKWFERLPSVGKAGVLVVGAIVGISLLSSFFKLLSSLLFIGILGGILYLAYKFFITPSSSE